jgi:hypothetical protein
MTTITFDTYTYVKKLKAVGFTEEQAELQAKTIAELSDERLVTREYLDMRLKVTREYLDLRLKELELRLENKIDKTENKIDKSSAQSRLYFIVLLCVIIVSNPKALELAAKIFGIVK